MANWLVGGVCGVWPCPRIRPYAPAHTPARMRPCMRVCGMVNTGSLAGILGGMLASVCSPCRTRERMYSGSVLLSHTIPRAVPSALEGLTTGFGMGPGVSLPL